MRKDGPFPMIELVSTYRSMPHPIAEVIAIDLRLMPLKPPGVTIAITAVGNASSTGWTNIHLEPYIYIQPPPDGIWDFNLMGMPPSGPAADVMTPVTTYYLMPMMDIGDFKGVRIHAATNVKVKKMGMKLARIPELERRAFAAHAG